VLLVCIDRDMSGWRASGAQSDPLDARLHDWSSAVAIPGLVPSTTSFSPAPTDAAALAQLTLDRLTTLTTAFNSLRTAYLTHTHLDPVSGTTGGPSLSPPAALSAPATVASTILKLGS